MSRYVIPRAFQSFLYHTGPLRLNALSTPTPDEFNELVGNVTIPYVAPSPANPTPDFVLPESTINILASYDQLIIDAVPYATTNGMVTNLTTEDYRMIRASQKPFWFVVRVDGYDQFVYQTAQIARDVAAQVMDAYAADILNYHLQNNFQGFAILNPNLNVMFSDKTAITREIQSYLVQHAHELAPACMVLTTRPNDSLTVLGPTITDNPNSNKALPYPILGQKEQTVRDGLFALYPNVAATTPNISLMLSQIAAFSTGYGLDRSTPLAIDYGMVFNIDPTMFVPDTLSGITGSFTKLQKIAAFLGALGVTNLCLSAKSPANLVAVPPNWAPTDALVNTSGLYSASWSSNGTVSISYTQTDGTIVARTFDATLTETTPVPAP